MTEDYPAIESLDELARIHLPSLGLPAGKASVKPSGLEPGKARQEYQKAGYDDLPNKYVFSEKPFSEAYQKLGEFEDYAKKLKAKPNKLCESMYHIYRHERGALEESPNRYSKEDHTRQSISETMINPATSIAAQLLTDIKGTTVYLRCLRGQPANADMAIEYKQHGTRIMMMEIKRFVPESIVQALGNLNQDEAGGTIDYELSGGKDKNKPTIIVAKLVVNMIDAGVKVALITDHHFWCFARLVKSNRRSERINGTPEPAETLILSKIYPHTVQEMPIVGTIVALLVDAMETGFKLDFAIPT